LNHPNITVIPATNFTSSGTVVRKRLAEKPHSFYNFYWKGKHIMEISQLIIERFSVRGYKSDPVEPEKINAMLEAARMAPSAANRQPYRLYVIKTAGREELLRKVYNSDWFVQAPYVICVCTLASLAWERKTDNQSYALVDAAIFLDHLILKATDLGLGTCWIAAFDPEAAREVLSLPEEETPVLFTPLGYPDAAARPKRRKTLDELVRYIPEN
jgi:nitroreductase